MNGSTRFLGELRSLKELRAVRQCEKPPLSFLFGLQGLLTVTSCPCSRSPKAAVRPPIPDWLARGQGVLCKGC